MQLVEDDDSPLVWNEIKITSKLNNFKNTLNDALNILE